MKDATHGRVGVASKIARLIEAREWTAARTLLEELLSEGPQSAETYNDYGRVLNNLGELEQACQAFASAISLKPDYAEAHNNLGHVLRAQGDYARAERHFSEAVLLRPDYAKAFFNRASALNLLGRNEEAVDSLREGLRLAPDDAMAHFNLATLYRFLDQYEGAGLHFREALRLRPRFAEAYVGLAGLQVHLGEIEAALATYREVLDFAPGNVDARIGISDILALQGKREEALTVLSADAGDANPRVAVAQAGLESGGGQQEKALERLLAIYRQEPEACAQMPRFYYLMADVYDRLGRHDEAMANYHRANALKNEVFDEAELVAAVDALIEVFSEDWLAGAPGSGNDSRRPVFIVGMPRSGTSLVEQILAGHPRVYGAGELNIIVEMVRELGRGEAGSGGYPRCVRALESEDLRRLALRYLEALSRLDAAAERVTDKLPHNFLHLGLIALLLPNSRVIHCRRDYRDTALSCYFQNFSSASMAFTNDLASIGAYYREYLRLMDHWRSVLRLPIYEVQYEALTDRQEEESRGLVEFIGLPWDPACLRFHELGRFVNTASHAQVRRPMYKTSVARYRNYEKHLAPLSRAVGKLP